MDPIFWFAVFLIGCLVAILVWVWKHVTPPPPPPTLTLTTSVASVESGNPITFAGTLMQGSTPLASKTVALAVTPPSGDGYSLSAITSSSGAYTLTWTVPSGAPTGTWTVAAAYSGATGVSKTFTQTAAPDGKNRDIGLEIILNTS